MTDILLNKNLEPLREFIDDLNFKEIVINEPYHLHIETIRGEWIHKENDKLSVAYLYGLSKLLAVKEGKRFNEGAPILAATIDGKHRVNVVFGKQTNHDISIAIRLKRNSKLDLNSFDISENDKLELINLVKQKKNILISGGTGTGKTTLLNSLVKFIDPLDRIITIENVREIEIDPKVHKNSTALNYLEDNPDSIAALLNASLRMRPDRILIGELRSENSNVFLRASNTGHEGTISTIHASSPNGAITALIHNIKSSSKSAHDEHQLKKEIMQSLDAVIQLTREYRDGEMIVKGSLRKKEARAVASTEVLS